VRAGDGDLMNGVRRTARPTFIRVHPWLIAVFVICFAFRALCADADYKQVFVFTNGDSVRVRLPLTDVTGKVRVKEMHPDGFGIPVAPSKTVLCERHYLEWQIGYDIPNTNSPSVVPQIKFQRNGETKYGHELSKIIYEAVRLGLLSTNDLIREMEALKAIKPSEFEESQPVQVEVSTNLAKGFQSAVERLPPSQPRDGSVGGIGKSGAHRAVRESDPVSSDSGPRQ